MPTVEFLREILNDDEQYAKLLDIPTRSGDVIPFTLSPIQKKYIKIRRSGKKRRVILKPRQIFISTIVLEQNFKDAITLPGTRVLILTHHGDATRLFRLTVRYWCEKLASIGMLPAIKTDTDNLLVFSNKSFMVFQTAGGKFGGRSTSFNRIHLSEIAWWTVDPAKILGGILPSAPDDAQIDIESTPNGAEGPLYDTYTDAKMGDVDWEPIFFRWFDNELYVRDVPSNFVLTTEELKVQEKYHLSARQMAWRRWMSSEMKRTGGSGSGGIFTQEYPENDISCFLAASDLVLDAEALEDYITFVQNPFTTINGWDIFKGPVENRVYVLCADPSEGKYDYSAGHVLDAITMEEVACFHDKVIPSDFAKSIDFAAREYNNALVVIETPGPGGRVIDRLQFGYDYTNFFYYFDEQKGQENDDPGWPQNAKTRVLAMDMLQELTKSRAFTVHSEKTVREMASLTWRKVGNMRRARAEAAPGSHDDLVLSLAIGLCTIDAALALARKTKGGFKSVPIRERNMNVNNPNWDGVIEGDLDNDPRVGVNSIRRSIGRIM